MKAISRKSTRNRIKAAKAVQQEPLDVKNVELFQQSEAKYHGVCKHVDAFQEDDKDHEDLWLIRSEAKGISVDLKLCDACARKEDYRTVARIRYRLLNPQTVVERIRQQKKTGGIGNGLMMGNSTTERGQLLEKLAEEPGVEEVVKVFQDPEPGKFSALVRMESAQAALDVQNQTKEVTTEQPNSIN